MESAGDLVLDLPSSCKVQGLEEELDSGKVSVSDQTNRFHCTTKPESFVIDIGSFTSGFGKESPQNSRITLQSDNCRKGLLRGNSKMSHDYAADTADSISQTGDSVGEVAMGLGSREQSGCSSGSGGAAVPSHQKATVPERCSLRRNSLKRSGVASSSWYLNPRKVFLLCATLSCVGTVLLIYFVFSSGMLSVEESELDY